MNPGIAAKICFQKYVVFNGRATRSEYWFFFLFTILLGFGLAALTGGTVGFVMGGTGAYTQSHINSVISQIVNIEQYIEYIIFALPILSVAIRRAHDAGRSGWYLLIPIYGFILMFFKSESRNNQYGTVQIISTDPKAPDTNLQ